MGLKKSRWAGTPSNTSGTKESPRPKTKDESLAWIEWNRRLYAERGFGLWAMESIETSEFLGDCGLTPQTVEGVTDIEVG
jgi:RimJ/RimL family protein N-acetyltransferase